jgi:hypothetical protein
MHVSRPVEAVVVSVRVRYQLGVARAIHRSEINHQGNPAPVFRNSRSLELVLRAVSRQEKGKRFRGEGIWIGASGAIFLVPLTGYPAIHFPDLAHDRDFTRGLIVACFEVQPRLDGPHEPLRRMIEVDTLYRGPLDADDVLRTRVELGDPFADAVQHGVGIRLRLRTGDRDRGERQCHRARQHDGVQQSVAFATGIFYVR